CIYLSMHYIVIPYTTLFRSPEIGTVSRLDEEETKKILPLTHEHTYRAVYISGAARVDGHALRKALINGATKHGATFIRAFRKARSEEHTSELQLRFDLVCLL